MNHQITLSIIFLCHNNQYIDVAINAVLEQIDANDEIIIVDDHSNLSTLAVLEKYKTNSNINIISSDKIANRSYADYSMKNMGKSLNILHILMMVEKILNLPLYY